MCRVFSMMSLIFLLVSCNNLSYNKPIRGYVEKVRLVNADLCLSTKLDTGAKSSSLYALNIKKFMKNGVPYLRFVVPLKDGTQITMSGQYL